MKSYVKLASIYHDPFRLDKKNWNMGQSWEKIAELFKI